MKMICQSPTDRNRVTWIHKSFAWAAARGIARDTHQVVILYGEFGIARFDGHGAGIVDWNEKSNSQNSPTYYDENTTVCI